MIRYYISLIRLLQENMSIDGHRIPVRSPLVLPSTSLLSSRIFRNLSNPTVSVSLSAYRNVRDKLPTTPVVKADPIRHGNDGSNGGSEGEDMAEVRSSTSRNPFELRQLSRFTSDVANNFWRQERRRRIDFADVPTCFEVHGGTTPSRLYTSDHLSANRAKIHLISKFI